MSKTPLKVKIAQAETLLLRLEKISADSPWSHQASGIRASLAKALRTISIQPDPNRLEKLDGLMAKGYRVLEKAAQEIPEDPSPS